MTAHLKLTLSCDICLKPIMFCSVLGTNNVYCFCMHSLKILMMYNIFLCREM